MIHQISPVKRNHIVKVSVDNNNYKVGKVIGSNENGEYVCDLYESVSKGEHDTKSFYLKGVDTFSFQPYSNSVRVEIINKKSRG